jgi:uncharacterized membrane protein
MLGRIATVAALAAGGVLLSQRMKKKRSGSGRDSSIEVSLDVGVPVRTAYNQWTQFEEFPKFMHSVHEVRQLDDEHLHWRASVAGKEKEWDAEITEQIPDRRIAWRSPTGPRNEGVVSFQAVSDTRTRVTLRMTYEPESAGEKIGDALGIVKREAEDNLERFKELIEARGTETGAWRGTIQPH